MKEKVQKDPTFWVKATATEEEAASHGACGELPFWKNWGKNWKRGDLDLGDYSFTEMRLFSSFTSCKPKKGDNKSRGFPNSHPQLQWGLQMSILSKSGSRTRMAKCLMPHQRVMIDLREGLSGRGNLNFHSLEKQGFLSACGSRRHWWRGLYVWATSLLLNWTITQQLWDSKWCGPQVKWQGLWPWWLESKPDPSN